MNALVGIFFHFIGGFASGSFYTIFKGVKNWSWENYWIIGGVFSWLIVPPLAAALTVPGFVDIISSVDQRTFWLTFFMGLFWGIGGLTYGLGIRFLGMSLGNSVILGFCAAFGALTPSLFYNFFPQQGKVSITQMMATPGGVMILIGVAICLIGIFICGRAGVMKEKDLSPEERTNSVKEFSLVKGLIVATISGILSACFNFGIEVGKPMADEAVRQGFNPLFQNNVTYVVLLWGGLTTNLVWCLILNFKNKTFGEYLDSGKPLLKNYTFSALAGTVWFLQFFFYGMGESKLGNGASSWILHMAFIIFISNMWGFVLKEWKGVSEKTLAVIIIGIITIVISVIFVGYGNSMAKQSDETVVLSQQHNLIAP